MSKKSQKDQFEEIVNEARETFDLGEFLRGRSVRTQTVRVFTDEVTAERRGGFTEEVEMVGSIPVPRVRSWGLVKELAEARDAYEKHESKTTKAAKADKARIDSLTDEIRALTAKLLETSLEIELRAVPEKIKKDAWRAARRAQGINGKNITDEQLVDLADERNAQILVRTVVSVTRHGGERNEGISIESARDLVDFLPSSEWDKISAALDELLAKKVIADQAVSTQDF